MSQKVVKIMISILVVMLFAGLMYVSSYLKSHYTIKNCKVVETKGQVVSAEDGKGNVWCYEVEGALLSTGTVIDLYMYTNYTNSYIYDDEVVDIIEH